MICTGGQCPIFSLMIMNDSIHFALLTVIMNPRHQLSMVFSSMSAVVSGCSLKVIQRIVVIDFIILNLILAHCRVGTCINLLVQMRCQPKRLIATLSENVTVYSRLI